ncbi:MULTISPECIES: hypothetical protein [Bacteroidales]|jgi:hypothetical protein|uniref:DUF7281 domain-containing protein n=2 Tax=Xylanibacter rodentium TaxID=2736289 RepID=A0ABX2AV75_9BACT|nr:MULTISPECIES: hypothetical protein [Bacteroidales]NPE11298.1 hypothetical protein [Prevotella sp. PJ1A]NPE13565.1 hypothetical protein [Xylanibacter rodentium]NPE38291.1 hypothetical protein [Prevotella sp. PCJ2]
MKITTALIDKLLQLRNGESLPASTLRGEWVDELIYDGVLISHSHGSRCTIIAPSPQHLEQALKHIDERLGNLEQMRTLMTKEISRADQASNSGNSKLVTIRSCPGFLINSYEQISCQLNGHEFTVHPQDGCFLFVANWQQFLIPEDVVVVGIENMENFRLIRQQKYLFSSSLPGKRLLFVSRYPQSTDLRLWLQTIPNEYIHFGDFDLAGIHIFLTEFYKYLGEKSKYLIPYDIEERLQHGSSERYNAQYQKFKNLTTESSSLQKLVDLINFYHRCYDQEGYIETK